VNNKAISKNHIVKIVPQTNEPTKLVNVLPVRNGAITPAESQATAPFVKNSDSAFLWPTDNLFTNNNHKGIGK